MCVIPWGSSGEEPHNLKETPEAAQGEGPRGGRLVHLCLVFGGMNIKGDIYNDCIVSMLEE